MVLPNPNTTQVSLRYSMKPIFFLLGNKFYCMRTFSTWCTSYVRLALPKMTPPLPLVRRRRRRRGRIRGRRRIRLLGGHGAVQQPQIRFSLLQSSLQKGSSYHSKLRGKFQPAPRQSGAAWSTTEGRSRVVVGPPLRHLRPSQFLGEELLRTRSSFQ